MLLDEVENMELGTANTYQGYKNNREKVFEKSQIALYDNTKQAISHVPSNNYISLIMNTTDGEYVVSCSCMNHHSHYVRYHKDKNDISHQKVQNLKIKEVFKLNQETECYYVTCMNRDFLSIKHLIITIV